MLHTKDAYGRGNCFHNYVVSFNKMSLNLQTSSSIFWISVHNLKYLDKLIKCLKMRANQRSVRKINEIFLCIFTYISKSDIFSTYLNFDNFFVVGYFKSQISKWPKQSENMPHVSSHRNLSSPRNKQILFDRTKRKYCINTSATNKV